ncbi:LuxR family transcriptional regulator [Gryllotalpicola kribbensis]|uniref:LuxR family transcriptional regulator n=1 Tax=Gryllotalpicola kribbensis TaxID=993084 RepID=A0ABP8AR53_9MICO
MATAATREQLRSAVERVSSLALEPHARVGSVLIYGPEGYQSAALLRDSIRLLEDWTLVTAVADERERRTDWSFLEIVNASLARFGTQVVTPLSAPGSPDDPAVVGRSLARAFAAVGGPICLLAENIHFADQKSADAVLFAVRRNARRPHLLVMSTESLANPTARLLEGFAHSRPEHNELVRLPALSPGDIQEIAVERLGRPVAGRVARRFAADTDGNPTLVAALLDAYRSDVLEAPHPPAVDLDRGRVVPLLPSQQRALQSAAPGARTAAGIVAVLREPTAVTTVGRIAAWLGLTEAFGAFDLDAAERSGLVHVMEETAVPTVAPPTRVAADCIAADIPLERRREIHAAAADVLTGPAQLRHRIGAARPEDTALVADLLEAARTRVSVGDGEHGMSLALAALQLATPGAEYEHALLFVGTLAIRLHEHQRIFHLKGDLASLPATALRDAILADLEVVTGHREAGIERALAVIAARGGSPSLRALAAHSAAMLPLYDAINDQHESIAEHVALARWVLAEAPARPQEVEQDLRWIVRPADNELWLTAWELVAAARLRDAERLADRMSRIDRLLRGSPDSPAAVDALVYQARTFLYAGRVTDAANRLHRVIRVAAGFPGSWLRHMALTMHAHVLFLIGDWEKSLLSGRMALDSAFDDPYPATLPTAYAVSGLVSAARAEVDQVRHIERMLSLLPDSGGGAVPYDPDLPDLLRAELALAVGDPLAQFQATETARVATRRGSVWSWLSLHIDALLKLGRTAEAISIANEALSGDSPWSRSPLAVSRLRARIALASRDFEQANRLYAGVVRSHTAAGLPFSLARDRVDYAESLRASGESALALEQLEQAAAVFRTLKASTYLLRTLESMDALVDGPVPEGGAAPAAAPLSESADLAELTAREREVALAVAGGLTNREVAELLYVSVTTVNFHVRNILGKLGLRSRRELRAIVHRGEGPVRS